MDSLDQALDALGLEGVSRLEVSARITSLRQDNIAGIRLRIRKGKTLFEIYGLIPHGLKLDWLAVVAPLAGYTSTRTAQRDMALAQRLAGREEELEALIDGSSLTALQTLSEAASPPEAIDLMNAEALAGREVTKARAQRAALVASILPGEEVKIAEGKLTLEDAASVAEVVADQPDDIKELVVSAAVRSPGVAQMLVTLHAERPAVYAEVSQSQAIYSPLTGLSVPLNEANNTDAEAYLNEEESESVKRSWAHKNKGTPAQRFAGTVAQIIEGLSHLAPELMYIVFVKPLPNAHEKEQDKTA